MRLVLFFWVSLYYNNKKSKMLMRSTIWKGKMLIKNIKRIKSKYFEMGDWLNANYETKTVS